jgi:hypothetical protein
VVTGPVDRPAASGAQPRPISAERLEGLTNRVLEQLEGYRDEAERNLGMLARTVARLRDGGLAQQIVVLDAPFNLEVFGDRGPAGLVREHRARMESFARRERVAFLRLDQAAALGPTDFLDHCHMDPTGTGPQRYSTALAERLSPLVLRAAP